MAIVLKITDIDNSLEVTPPETPGDCIEMRIMQNDDQWEYLRLELTKKEAKEVAEYLFELIKKMD